MLDVGEVEELAVWAKGSQGCRGSTRQLAPGILGTLFRSAETRNPKPETFESKATAGSQIRMRTAA